MSQSIFFSASAVACPEVCIPFNSCGAATLLEWQEEYQRAQTRRQVARGGGRKLGSSLESTTVTTLGKVVPNGWREAHG